MTDIQPALTVEPIAPLVNARASLKEDAPLRVLHVHSGNLYGGVETTLMAQVLNRQLCPQMSLSFALCFEDRFSEELYRANADVTLLGACRIRNPSSIRRARNRLRRLLGEADYDVAVTHSAWSHSLFGLVVQRAGVPLVSWVHGLVNPKHWLERWASMIPSTMAICNSEFTATSLRVAYPHLKAAVAYNPLISVPNSLPEGRRLDIREALGISTEKIIITQVSRMEEGKGQAVLINGLARLKEMPNWVCLQVGGPQRKKEFQYMMDLKTYAANLGISERVMFIGERSDVPFLLAASDVLCQPNTRPETFGNVFIEGMCAGLPVITTAIGGALEIVNDTCGFLLPLNDLEALSSSLRFLIENPAERKRMGALGFVHAREISGLEGQMTRISELLRGAGVNNRVPVS